jgi:hypothetical protein
MVVGFTTTYTISAYHHCCEFESRSLRGVLDKTLCDKVCQWLAVVFSWYSGFLHQWNWPPRYSWNIVESGVKHHKQKPKNPFGGVYPVAE